VALLRGGQAEFGVEQNRRGVLGQDIGDLNLELLKVVRTRLAATLLGNRLLQRAALVHGSSGDDAAHIGDGLKACKFSWGQLHRWEGS